MQPRHSVQRNQWHNAKGSWTIPPLPESLSGSAGILPIRVSFDAKIGSEVVLYVLDPTPFIFDIAALRPFRLNLKTGVVRTEGGPLMFLLWWLSSPQGDEPFTMFETTLNPHDPSQLSIYRDLARQTHWHVVVIGPDSEVLDLYELENGFDLSEALDFAVEACTPFPCIDFDAAKAEFERTYSLQELFEMDG